MVEVSSRLACPVVVRHAISEVPLRATLECAPRKRLEAARIGALAARISTFASTILKKLVATALRSVARAAGGFLGMGAECGV